LSPRVIDRVTQAVDEGEVLRYLGYPIGVAASPRIRDAFDHWVEEADQRASPRATYIVLPVVEMKSRSLRLQTADGVIEFRGAIGEFLGAAQRVAAFIATAGPGVERLASELLQQGDELGAMIASAVGAERAEAAEAAVIAALREQFLPHGLVPTLPYSPGYCGMAITQQDNLFALFGNENVGVELLENCLMRPLKSVSGLIGIGPAEEIESYGSPCDRCELHNCAMRR
jgi:hypothetical protein